MCVPQHTPSASDDERRRDIQEVLVRAIHEREKDRADDGAALTGEDGSLERDLFESGPEKETMNARAPIGIMRRATSMGDQR